MAKSLKNTSKKKITIKKATLSDVKFIFNTYNHGVDKSLLKKKKLLKFKDHKKWFLENYKSKKVHIYTAYLNILKIGYIRFDFKNRNLAVVSISLNKNYYRKGYGSIVLNLGILKIKKIPKIQYIIANVFKKNEIFNKFFKKNKFINNKSINMKILPKEMFQKNFIFIYHLKI